MIWGAGVLKYYLTPNRWIKKNALFETHTKATNQYFCMTVNNNIMSNDTKIGGKCFSVGIFFVNCNYTH